MKRAQVSSVIAALKALRRADRRLGRKLAKAERDAATIFGERPSELITWRGYLIGYYGIQARRDELRGNPRANRAKIAAEYRKAMGRHRAALRAQRDWDHKAGLTALRQEAERAGNQARAALVRLSRLRPASPGEAGEMLRFVLRDMQEGDMTHHLAALASIGRALASMRGAA